MVGFAPPVGNADAAYRYFLARGWTPAQAAGIVGNLQQESGPGLDPTIVGDGGAAYGIAQWNDRRDDLHGWAQAGGMDPAALQTQLDFISHELNTTEGRAAAALRGAQTPEEAARAFLGFERPQGFSWADPTGSHGYQNRVANALRLYGGGTMPQPMSSMPASAPAAGGQDMASGGLLGVPAAPALRQSWLGGLLDIQPSEDQGLLGSFINPQDNADREGLRQFAAAMLQASAPSTDPAHGSFGYGLGQALGGYGQGREFGARADERKLRQQTRMQVEAAIAALPPEQQAWARANPDAFAQLMLERQFGQPQGPNTQGAPSGYMWNADQTGVIPIPGAPSPDAGMHFMDGGLVLNDQGGVVADYRQNERGVNTAGLPQGFMWDPTGTQAIPIPGVPSAAPDQTSLEQNLIAAGFVPGTPEFQQQMLKALQSGNSTTITMDTTPEDPANVNLRKMQEALGTQLGTQYSDMMTGGQQANLMLGDLTQLDALLAQSPQGTLGPLMSELGGLATSLGIDVGDIGTPSAQAMASIVNRMIPSLRPPGSGSMSDGDVAMFRASLPALSNTPEGNRVIVAVLRAMAERRVQEGQIATGVATGQLTPAKAQQMLANLGPYISPDLAQAIAGAGRGDMSGIPVYTGSNPTAPVHVTTEEEFLALPPGTMAVMPDGSVIRRPSDGN